MARAKRHYVPGQVWQITHRCHKREFLLKFKKDRRRWIQWLFEAKRRFGLVVLNYTVLTGWHDEHHHKFLDPGPHFIYSQKIKTDSSSSTSRK